MSKKVALFLCFGIFTVGTLAAVPLRVYELLYAMDSSGFYLSGNHVVPVLNGLLLAVTVLLLLPFFIRALPVELHWTARSRAVGVVAFVAAAGFLGDVFARFYTIMSAVTLQAGLAFGDFLIAVAAFLSAVYFLRLGIGLFSEKAVFHPVTALFPIIWGVLVLAVSFMQYTTIANISEQLFDVLRMVFLLLFFYYNARVTGRMPNGKEYRGLVSFGLPAALFVFVTVPPRLIARLMNGSRGSMPGMEDWLNLVLAVYIMALLLSAAVQHYRQAPERSFVDYEALAGGAAGQGGRLAGPSANGGAAPDTAATQNAVSGQDGAGQNAAAGQDGAAGRNDTAGQNAAAGQDDAAGRNDLAGRNGPAQPER